MLNALQRFVHEEDGVDAIEYGILLAMLFLVIVGAVAFTASQSTGIFDSIATHVQAVPPGP